MKSTDQNAHCPPVNLLRQIGAETMDEELFGAIEIHVEGCPRCQRRLEEFARVSRVAFSRRSLEEESVELPEVSGFTVKCELGRGAGGVVYLAKEDETERLVALKMIPGGWMTGPRGRARWLAEARAVARVNDDHIVRLFRVEERPQFFLMVFEYVSGGTLAGRLSGPLPPRQAVMIMKTLARALGKIHETGLLHLDLKPSNILVEGRPGADWPELTLKISDFGIARLNQLQDRDDSIVTGIRGTPAFMAPEQAESDLEKIGKPTDIYGLGVIFYLLLTGRMPFQGASTVEVLDQVRFQRPVAISRWNPEVDSALEQICLKCMSKATIGRYESTEDLVRSLDLWIEAGPGLLHFNNWRGFGLVRCGWRLLIFGFLVSMGLIAFLIHDRTLFNGPAPETISQMRVMDHAGWIYALTKDIDGFHGNELNELLAVSRVHAGKLLGDLGQDAGQIARQALLLKNLCLKLNNTLNRKNIEISAGFLDLASILFQESYRREPGDQWIVRELVHCESAYALIHIPFDSENEDLLKIKAESIIRHLDIAAARLDLITDQRTRLFHELRLLDYCQFNAIVFRGSGYWKIAGRIRAFELRCLDLFERDRQVPDLAARYEMARGRFPDVKAEGSWLIQEDEMKLKWKWLAFTTALEILDFTMGDNSHDFSRYRVWAKELITRTTEKMRSHRMDVSLLPRIVMSELIRSLVSVSSFLRSYGGLERAVCIEKVFLEISRELLTRYPDDPYSMLLLSEAHLQTWKNHLRENHPEEALKALRRSLMEARRAAELTPDFSIARDMADDRESRIARFLSRSAGEKP